VNEYIQKQLFQINLEQIKYQKVWEIQKRLVELRYLSKIPDSIIVCEHDPVITMGRGTDRKNLLVTKESLQKKNIDLFEIERGGDITFHGPGQAILYQIIDLRNRDKDTHKYLRDLEKVVINALGKLGLEAGIKKGLTGIWVNDFKVGAIGVAVSKWITYHGLALNVNTDLDYFKLINPCGITEYPVGSISRLLKKTINIEDINKLLINTFFKYFAYEQVMVKKISEFDL
jgi:lipoate-protein ligase B